MDFLVLGLVMGVGTDKTPVLNCLKSSLNTFDYEYIEISASKLIMNIYNKTFKSNLIGNDGKDEYKRILAYMKAGDKLREKISPDIIVLAAISFIKSSRKSNQKQAFVITNLKHPDEVKVLRAVYLNSFYLIGVHSILENRKKFLLKEKGILDVYGDNATEKVKDLFEKDDAGEKRQSINNTFHLADYFIAHNENSSLLSLQIERFLKILHSYPYETPTKEEHFMFMAYTSSLRSSDLSRQVGAVLVSKDDELISTGANEVPKSGGGLYWSNSEVDDERDFIKREDKNAILKNETILNVLKVFMPKIKLKSDSEKLKALKQTKKLLGENLLFEMSEYNRSVHAEMEALLACGRVSGNSKGGRLYTTTFPCHNCAKHIIAAGIKEVVYIEPYTKSKATYLYDSIRLEYTDEPGKVVFKSFIGMSHRRYFDLFSMNLGNGRALQRKDAHGRIVEWNKKDGKLRLPVILEIIQNLEVESLKKFNKLTLEKN